MKQRMSVDSREIGFGNMDSGNWQFGKLGFGKMTIRESGFRDIGFGKLYGNRSDRLSKGNLWSGTAMTQVNGRLKDAWVSNNIKTPAAESYSYFEND